MIQGDYTKLQTPLRQIKGKVELSSGSSTTTFSHTDKLKEFKIERLGESGKFFGFGICQKLTVKLLDKDMEIDLRAGGILNAMLASADEEYIEDMFPLFYIDTAETKRDNKTNELTIVAYDRLADLKNHTFSELGLIPPYTYKNVIDEIVEFFSNGDYPIALSDDNMRQDFDFFMFADGANYEGTETLKEVLDDIAEATQTIYYIDEYRENLMFKRLTLENISLSITQSDYFECDNKDMVGVGAVCHATELGDNVIKTNPQLQETTQITQYVRDNGFWTVLDGTALAMSVEHAANNVKSLFMCPFNLTWRGNFYLEIGDKIEVDGKTGSFVSYVLNDTIEYNGALKQTTSWEMAAQEETEANPSSLGDVLKQTYAKVDKANKRIEMVASESSANTSAISSLQINTEGILGSVSKLETQVKEGLEANTNDIAELKKSVETQITPESVSLQIKEELNNGVSKVETATGFVFNEDGLTVNKTGKDITTTITEDGMTVKKNEEAVLTANNEGVIAIDLKAKTYLIIGENSRFEDFGDRTACFWIGGNS